MSETAALYAFDRAIQGQNSSALLVGLDEAGRGPLAGPVVAAAVVLDLDNPVEGINDSKKVAPDKREYLFGAITGRARAWAVARVEPRDIDRLNILQASLLAMKQALDQIALPWTLAIVDGNQSIRGLAAHNQRTIVGGDARSASIAAASIVAKVTRDRIMVDLHAQYPAYEFNLHKGYPTKRHRMLVAEYGLCDIHRRSFCTRYFIQTRLPLQ